MPLAIHTRARLALLAASLAAALALTADHADAAVTPTIQNRTLIVTGDATSEKLALRVPATAPATLELDAGDNGTADFRIARARFDRIRVLAGDGADRVRIDDAGVRGATLPPTILEGQGGNDTLLGGRAAESLNGGDGKDLVDGNGGDDAVALGAGDDGLVWDAPDGSDSVDGGDGFDRLDLNGSAAGEQMRLAADGARARLTRDAAPTGLDAGGVESLAVAALGGADTLTVGDLEATPVQEVRADLAGTPGGTAADTGSDRLIVDGTSGADSISVISTSAGRADLIGLPSFISVAHADPTSDELTVRGLAGNDRIDAANVANAFKLVAEGGAGADQLSGGNGADVLDAGDGNDVVDARRGDDDVRLGAGDDQFLVDAGDGRDTLEAQAGKDGVRFTGSSAGEQFDVSAAGPRVRLSVGGAVAVDAREVEALSVFSFGGADRLTVADLSGTGLTAVDVSLFDFAVPGGDQDVVRVDGTAAADAVTVAGSTGGATVSGLAATVRITGAAAAGDRLEVNGLAGADTIDSTDLPAAALQFRADGGADNDTLLGGDGDDVLTGGDGGDVVFAGRGDNVALGGAGDDVLRGEDGDDVLDGGAGDDVLIGRGGDDILLNGEVVFDD